MMRPQDVAVCIGHYKQTSAVELSLAILRKQNPGPHPIMVVDDCSPADAQVRLARVCERHGATLRASSSRLGHVGGDLRAFYHGLLFAERMGARYLVKLSQRRMFDIPNWLCSSAELLKFYRLPIAGQRAGTSVIDSIAYMQTSAVMVEVERWTAPHSLNDLKPRPVHHTSAEWLVGNIWHRMGNVMLGLPGMKESIFDSTPEAPWHDDPKSHGYYVALAEKYGVTLGKDFHIGGSQMQPDGTNDPDYR